MPSVFFPPVDHVCQCRDCKPDVFPPCPAAGAHYIVIDHIAKILGGCALNHTFLDGVPAHNFHMECDGELLTEPLRAVAPCIIEVCAGVVGWYVVDSHGSYGRNWHPRDCSCGSGLPCSELIFGRVKLKAAKKGGRWYDGLTATREPW